MKRFAFLLLSVGAAAFTANAFNFNYNANTNGSAMHWSFTTPVASVPTNSFNTNTHAIRFYVASDAYSSTNTAAEINAVRNCFGQWQSISNTLIRFEDVGLAPAGYTRNTSDNSNVVFWAKSSSQVLNDNISGALGVTYSLFRSGQHVAAIRYCAQRNQLFLVQRFQRQKQCELFRGRRSLP